MSSKISVAKLGNVFGSIIRFSFAVLYKVEKTFNLINIFCKIVLTANLHTDFGKNPR